jgi:sporulation protein YlmC with PRC-barrel domain
MSRISLSDAGHWHLKFPDDQDIRGYAALDENGNRVGVVDTMIVNTDEQRVDAIVLEDGQEFAARNIAIGDDVVYLAGVADTHDDDADGTVTVYDDYGHVERRETVDDADYDAHADAFRTHYTSTYGDAGGAYDDYEPAYRYGYEKAHEDDYRNTSYHDAEQAIRDDFGVKHPDRDYDRDRDAVRYGYTRAQHTTR